MDGNEKKVFDVAHPRPKKVPADTAKATAAPVIVKRQMLQAPAPSAPPIPGDGSEPADKPAAQAVAVTVHRETTVQPLHEPKKPDKDTDGEAVQDHGDTPLPAAEASIPVPEPAAEPDSAQPAAEPGASKAAPQADKDGVAQPAEPPAAEQPEAAPPKAAATLPADERPSRNVFEAVDNVPDTKETAAKEAAKAAAAPELQEPKIYDTKEYYVPIGKTHHAHGRRAAAAVFAVVCALIVLAVGLYLMADVGLIDLGFELPIDLL